MPMELLSKMFLSTKEGDEIHLRVGDPTDSAYVIASVCRRWHDIAKNQCPALWASLAFSFGTRSREIEGRMSFPTAIALRRSSNRPLDIKFQASLLEDRVGASIAVLRILLLQSARWRSIDMIVGSAHLHLLEDLRNAASLLSSAIGMRNLQTPITTFAAVIEFKVASSRVMEITAFPVLETLVVEPGFVWWADLNSDNMDTLTLSAVRGLLERSHCQHTLQELEFHNVPLTGHILPILHLAPNLSTLVLRFAYWNTDADRVFSDILLELKHTQSDGSLVILPRLHLLMLSIQHTPVLAFWNEQMVQAMESCAGKQVFTFRLYVDSSHVYLPPLTKEQFLRLKSCSDQDSCLKFNDTEVTVVHA
ncbi:hypothetical protein F5146DRAFT_1144071 [Armillaria mellea]|nr:hypothetical protein F5146DRAFT_1144071 [Armillaria mellea]